MGNLFGAEKPLKERIREELRKVRKGIREVDKQINMLNNSERKLNSEIRSLHESGQEESVRIKCKDLVRSRKFVKHFINFKSHLEGLSLKIQSSKSHHDIGEAMKGATAAMKSVNSAISTKEIRNIMKDFAKENEKSEIQQEMMGDVIDDALEEDDSAAQEEEVYQVIMAELGLAATKDLSSVPTGSVDNQNANEPIALGADNTQAELDARLSNVRRNNP